MSFGLRDIILTKEDKKAVIVDVMFEGGYAVLFYPIESYDNFIFVQEEQIEKKIGEDSAVPVIERDEDDFDEDEDCDYELDDDYVGLADSPEERIANLFLDIKRGKVTIDDLKGMMGFILSAKADDETIPEMVDSVKDKYKDFPIVFSIYKTELNPEFDKELEIGAGVEPLDGCVFTAIINDENVCNLEDVIKEHYNNYPVILEFLMID